MSERYLDLDAFVPEPITFKWKGQEYTVESISTEAFLRWSKLQEAAENARGDDIRQIELAPEMLHHLVPSLPIDEGRMMELPALWKLVNWIMGQINADLERLGFETKNVVEAGSSTSQTSSPDSSDSTPA